MKDTVTECWLNYKMASRKTRITDNIKWLERIRNAFNEAVL